MPDVGAANRHWHLESYQLIRAIQIYPEFHRPLGRLPGKQDERVLGHRLQRQLPKRQRASTIGRANDTRIASGNGCGSAPGFAIMKAPRSGRALNSSIIQVNCSRAMHGISTGTTIAKVVSVCCTRRLNCSQGTLAVDAIG